ncbi:MAG: hypothetical protein R3E88_11240 [Myxococcota bacterium]|nr:hypothetical protein [Myxococcales bacterium]
MHVRGSALRRRLRALACAAAVAGALVTACRMPATGIVQTRAYGLVVGSVQVQLQRSAGSPTGVNLVRSGLTYTFELDNDRQAWNRPTPYVQTTGGPQPFALSLLPGRNRIDELGITVYDGPGAWFAGLLSRAHGADVPLALAFDADPRRVTYVGRIRVVLPSRLGEFDGPVRVTVEDASEEDLAAYRSLLEGTSVPIETHLARVGR